MDVEQTDGEQRGALVSHTLRELAALPLWWTCAIALCIHQAEVIVMNSTLFPLFNGVFLPARDIGTAVSMVLPLIVLYAVYHVPHILRPQAWTIGSAVIATAGHAMSIAGATSGSAVVLMVGVFLRATGNLWVSCLLMLSLVELASERGKSAAFWALCVGWALSYLLEFVASLLPAPVQLALMLMGPAIVCVLCHRPSARLVEGTASAPPASELAITNPHSFVPFASPVFVTLVVLKTSFGFAMTFASVDATPQATVLACVPTLAIAFAFAIAHRPGLDGFYKATMLCVLAGFLLVNPSVSSIPALEGTANVVLRAGSDLTRIFAFMVVAYLGTRNPVNALGVALFVSLANSAGSLAGAQLGMLANRALLADPGAFALLLMVIVFAFVAYNVIAPHNLRFDDATEQIEALPEQRVVELPTDVLVSSCARVASEHNLTPREAEALELLARGRNTAAIQERMTVSRSTAKTHVRNVYAKLGVHSQQELIDLVEQA